MAARGLLVAGSGITFDGTQIAKATLHGVSNETRANEYAYDDLSRLARSRAARISGAADLAVEQVDKADFRNALERTTTGPAPLPSLSFAQQTGHKIAEMVRGGQSRTFSYGSGAERIDDGRFIYEFDARGRLISATEKPATSAPQTLRRILYYYSAADRVVGRRAEYAPLASGPVSTWKLEDRPEVLDADALPADVTFVWDPISDTLVTVSSLAGEPLRQIIQGGSGYDDPIEVAVAENSTVHRLHPVFDEAGAGTLQVILNENGEVISRTVEEGAYGEDEFGLAGAAVDRIAIEATKTSSGALQSVTISIRTTEQLAASTIATGARLAVLDANGAVVRSSPTKATLFENYTLRWTLTAEEWTALTSTTGNPQRLSIAVTNTLRAAAWSNNNGILPAPDWAPSDTMHSSGALPVEYRAPLTEVSSWLGAAAPSEKTLFEATSLSALGGKAMPAARLILAAGFQALPFAEPATGLIYVRARWYDPSAGSFLTPDPMGYQDSSNLYAFGAGDPVNRRDPTGNCLGLDKKGRPCSYYAGKLSDFVVDSMGLNQIPGTGIKKIDSAMRKATAAPIRLAVTPLKAVLSTGDASGEYLYRMERSTFHGEMPIDPGKVDDQLLMLGVMGDVATFISPAGLLEGEAPSFGGRAAKSSAKGPLDVGTKWGTGIQKQGMPWENYLEKELGAETRLPERFKAFDYFSEETGIATSAKTLDTTTASRMANPKQVYSALKRSIDAAANFTSYELKGVSLSSDAIAAREIRVAVPSSTNAAQWVEIKRAAEYAKTEGVRVIVTVVK